MTTYAVIMAGGSGTRFWPVSRAALPKQLVRMVGDTTMIQATVARMQPLIPPERVLVVTTAALAAETRRQLPMLKPEHIIAEPMGRDTAACVCLAALVVERLCPGATMVLLPADQIIRPIDDFQKCLFAGIEMAERGALVTYGIQPRFAATGYGYIQLAEQQADMNGIIINRVARFVEKPNEEYAKSYIKSGDYRWNSGIFTWKSDVVLRELSAHCSWLTQALMPVAAQWGTPRFDAVLKEVYEPLKRISIDYALMEKAKSISVVTANFTWDDVGSWDALYDHLPANADGVIERGSVLTQECHNSLLVNEGQQILIGVGLENLSVVVTADSILIMPKGRSQQVKDVVEALKAKGRTDLL